MHFIKKKKIGLFVFAEQPRKLRTDYNIYIILAWFVLFLSFSSLTSPCQSHTGGTGGADNVITANKITSWLLLDLLCQIWLKKMHFSFQFVGGAMTVTAVHFCTG